MARIFNFPSASTESRVCTSMLHKDAGRVLPKDPLPMRYISGVLQQIKYHETRNKRQTQDGTHVPRQPVVCAAVTCARHIVAR